MNLYDLTGELLQLQEMLEDPDIDTDILYDTLAGVEGEYDDKVEGWCMIIRNLTAQADALDIEVKRLNEKKKAVSNRIEWMKRCVFESLKVTGRKKAGGALTAQIKTNGGKLPVILDKEVEEFPPDLVKWEAKPDMDEIRKYLDTGVVSPWCHYGERGEHLEVK